MGSVVWVCHPQPSEGPGFLSALAALVGQSKNLVPSLPLGMTNRKGLSAHGVFLCLGAKPVLWQASSRSG